MQNRSSLRRAGAGTAYSPQLPVRTFSSNKGRPPPSGGLLIPSKTKCALLSSFILVLSYVGFTIYSFKVINGGISTQKTSQGAATVLDPTSSYRQYIASKHQQAPIDEGGSRSFAKIEPLNPPNDDHHKGQALQQDGQDLSDPSLEEVGTIATSFHFDESKAEAALKQYGAASIFKPITAYIEPPLNDTIPGTGSRGDLKDQKDKGTPPQFRIPLPLRTHGPQDLLKVQYTRVQTCHDMPAKFPVDRGLEMDAQGNTVVWNVADEETVNDFAEKELPFCPVESDPYLPWIHDVFPSQDGSRIEFIAQNKRRCRTGSKYTKDVQRLAPQAALMQPISVQRIEEAKARELAPELWYPEKGGTAPRYRLVPHNESSSDGMFTRFICRFHATSFESGSPQTVYLGETLSQYPFNYELVSYRKNQETLITAKGKDTVLFWASNIRFHCPVPKLIGLRDNIAQGDLILSDGTPTIYVDLVPIRTSVRYNEHMLTEEQIGPRDEWEVDGFDPYSRWGAKQVIPRFEASGRWENIPICLPPQLKQGTNGVAKLVPNILKEKASKPHYLSACVWASAEFKTRGLSRVSDVSSDTFDRLTEWIEFHLLVGFDQIYLYDNSRAQTNETTLKSVADKFPGQITYIDWPSIVCNNNIPAHDNTGERSSQYAAENSCRTRYGPFTEWIASFDPDEYLVPMGNNDNLKDVLRGAAAKGTNILSFRSSRGRLRPEACLTTHHGTALEKRKGVLFLEAYNCDSVGFPKPDWAERARKQVYRPDYVHYHFVHYSTVPDAILTTYADSQKEGGLKWTRHHVEDAISERITNELDEAIMIHTKTVSPTQTTKWTQRCHKDYEKKWLGCWVAFPWPNNTEVKGEGSYNKDGELYNCFVNEKVEKYWLPRLKDALKRRKEAWSAQR